MMAQEPTVLAKAADMGEVQELSVADHPVMTTDVNLDRHTEDIMARERLGDGDILMGESGEDKKEINVETEFPMSTEPTTQESKTAGDILMDTAGQHTKEVEIKNEPLNLTEPVAQESTVTHNAAMGEAGSDKKDIDVKNTEPKEPATETLSKESSAKTKEVPPASPLTTSAGPSNAPVQQPLTAVDLDVDSNSDADSAIGDLDNVSSTVSLRSSIYESVEENGRKYHRYKAGNYMLPNDEMEQNRLDLQHHLMFLTLNGNLHLAPIPKTIQDVLDLGTGTGIWAIDFATNHPSARVIGTDLSPIQPVYVPPNCSFEVDDAEDPWLYSQKFDYIHGRFLISCFKNFPNVVKQAYEFTKPGGYFELQDALPFTCYDDSWNGSTLQEWMGLLLQGSAKLGMDWSKSNNYKRYLEEAGFEDVVQADYAWPTNPLWPRGKHFKTLGRWMHQNMMDATEGVSMGLFTRVHGWTQQAVKDYVVKVKKDLGTRSIHAYVPVRVVYGRKPL